MSSKGQPFNNDSGDKNVGVTNPDADNTQPLAIKRMDKPKHDVGQTGASNDESEERSGKKKGDSVSKSGTIEKEKERHRVKSQEEGGVTKDECFTEQSTDLTNVELTTKIEQLEYKNRELEQSLYDTEQELIKEKEKNKQDLKSVVEDKIAAVMNLAKAEEKIEKNLATAEEVIEKHKSDIEDKTHTISDLNNRIRQMEEAARVGDKKNKSLTESINKLKQEVEERDQTIRKVKESTKQLKKDLKDTKSREMELQKKERQLKENLTSFKTTNNELVQSKDRYVENLNEMEALKSKLEQDLSRKNADYQVQQKDLNESREQIRSLTLRLSKIAGANLAFQNPNIADLGDPNRPTKLAERLSELYDNQWTDAFEQIDLQDDEEKIKRLYDIFKKLDGHCHDVCWKYDAAVKESLTNLTVTSKIKVLKPERTQEAENDIPSENGVKIPSEKDTTLPLQTETNEEMTGNVGLCNTYLRHNKETEIESRRKRQKEQKKTEEKKKKEKGKKEKKKWNQIPSNSSLNTGQIESEKKMKGDLADENNEYNPDVKSDNESNEAAPDVTQDTHELEDDTDCKKGTNSAEKERSHVELVNQNDQSAEMKSDFNVKTEGNECTDDIFQPDVVPIKEEKQTKQDEQKENEIYLKFDFDTLTNSHKQTISEIRRIVHVHLEDQVVKAISQAVLEEMKLPREKGVVSYVEECAKICWLARLHDPPINIEFEEIKDDSPFKAEMYKAYTKTGKRLDYVVWPPVFLYKKGPMLSKGVAQGM